MPVISIGDGGQERHQATQITSSWLELGGRGIDTAYSYRNQAEVAQAIESSGVDRKDVFITTKIPNCADVDSYVQQDLSELNTDYIDLMLIHDPSSGDCPSAWKSLEAYYGKGILRAIGISNFERSQIESVMKIATVAPHVHQMELNVLVHDADQIAASQEHGMIVEAYSPLGRSGHTGDIPAEPTIQAIAAAHNVSTYQIAIKWILQNGYHLAFQSSNPVHQESDADVFSFNLTDAEMAELDTLSAGDVLV